MLVVIDCGGALVSVAAAGDQVNQAWELIGWYTTEDLEAQAAL